MSVIALRYAWRCVVCDEHGEGTSLAVDRAAAKHTEKNRHATLSWAEPTKAREKK